MEQALENGERLRAGGTLLLAQAPDPEALGRIRRVVASAHSWGGNGTEPQFRKIRQVLLRKHPEVIARAFGGNVNVAAAWIKNNWYRMRGMDPPSTRKRRVRMALSRYQEVPLEVFDGGSELFSADYDAQREGNLIWVTALREGEWKVNPIPRKTEPLVLDRAFMEDIMRAWREGAWEYVTVPTYHTDQDVLANTGYVRDLRILPDPARPGKSVLRAGLEFTEPAVEEKVLRGSIAGVSINVRFNVRHMETGKQYSKVLTHIALTNMPFINGLRAFERKLAASNEFPEDVDITGSYEFEGDEATWLALADAWDPERDLGYVREQIEAHLHGSFALDGNGELYDMRDGTGGEDLTPASVFVIGMTNDTVLLAAHAAGDAESAMVDLRERNGECEGWVAGYSLQTDGEVVLDPIDEWVQVRRAWVEMDREFTLLDELPISGEGDDHMSADVVQTTESPRGGDGMADAPGTESGGATEEEAASVVTPEVEAPASFTREELDRIADERAQAALDAYRQEQERAQLTRDEELAAARNQLHEMAVRERIAELETAGHAPAVLQLAREYMLADVRHESMLSLTREEGEVQVSATDIVTEFLSVIPATALTRTDEVFVSPKNPVREDSVEARADRFEAVLNGN